MAGLLDIIAEDKYAIAYRPRFTALTDSALAAILLQEMIYFWKSKEGKPFYKFKEPCDHDDYREGDSWCEALGFNKHEFDTALKVIGVKVTKGASKNDLLATEYPERKAGETDEQFYERFSKALQCCVLYWTDRNRKTWFQVNETLLCKFVDAIYISNDNGLRYHKKCIVAFRSKKSWEQRRKDSTKVSTKATNEYSFAKYAKIAYFTPALIKALSVEPQPDLKIVDPDKPTYQQWLIELSKVFGISAQAAELKHWYNVFNGRAANGKWKEGNITPAATLEDVKLWHAYEIRQNLQANSKRENPHTGKYRSALAVNTAFLTWRDKRDAQLAEKAERAELDEIA